MEAEAEIEIKYNRRVALQPIRIEDFWNRMQKPVGCWLYDGAKEINGYGYVKNPLGDSPKYLTAHRLAWILKNGPIPDGMKVLHKCDVRACCNPEHLFLGTHALNMADMNRKGRNGSTGARSIHAKLTEAQVLDIRARYQRTLGRGGHTIKSNVLALAAEYGVTRGTIQHAALGHTWKSLK